MISGTYFRTGKKKQKQSNHSEERETETDTVRETQAKRQRCSRKLVISVKVIELKSYHSRINQKGYLQKNSSTLNEIHEYQL